MNYNANFNMQVNEIEPYLIKRLKQEHCLWSYDQRSVKDIPNDIVIELAMLYLDIDDINLLFKIFPYKEIKQTWLTNCVAQREQFYNLNIFFAWNFFMRRNHITMSSQRQQGS